MWYLPKYDFDKNKLLGFLNKEFLTVLTFVINKI